MADAVDTVTYEDPATAISQGKRHLLVRDYSMAVTALAEGCRMLAEKFGETADELGEPYLHYGRALLFLSREESGVLGTGVPGTDEVEEDAEEADGDEEEGEGEEEEETAEKNKEENGEEEKSTEAKSTKAKEEKLVESKQEENGTSKKESPASSSSTAKEESAGNSKMMNGDASTSKQNGDAHEDDDDGEDLDNEDDDDSSSNLQLAWEILELSKLILLKRGEAGWKLLAETHRLLGEVAMESGNQQGALTDLNACLDLLRKIEPADARSMAETHYQLGLAYSLGNDFDDSIEQFNEATSLLETRIKELQEMTDAPKSTDPFYSIEGEIKELKELLPEIQDKITDMRDFKRQACKILIEGIKSSVAGGSCSNGAGPSGSSSSSSAAVDSSPVKEIKPASDISHLVRKKRKPEDDDTELESPCKKPTPEKVA